MNNYQLVDEKELNQVMTEHNIYSCIWNSGCTAHSLSKLKSRLHHIFCGLLVFEFWRLRAGLLVTLFHEYGRYCAFPEALHFGPDVIKMQR